MNNLYKTLIMIVLLLVLGFVYCFYKSSTIVTAEFKNLRPFHTRAPIYYNGFKIGKVVGVKPNQNYTATIVTLWLYPHNLRIPINVIVYLKKERNRCDKKFDYVDIIYPEKPSGFYLKDGDRIAGKTTVELETYLANQDPDSLEAIKADFAETVKNLNLTVQTLGELFSTLNLMAVDVSPNIIKASKDLSKSADNFVKISQNADVLTGNLNRTLNEKRMNSTAKNIQVITNNVKTLTGEFNKTMPQIKCTVCGVNRILDNIEEMTSGINCTLRKPFGGFRLFFGRPVCKNK